VIVSQRSLRVVHLIRVNELELEAKRVDGSIDSWALLLNCFAPARARFCESLGIPTFRSI
jgi:hypothetical protein